MLNTTATAIRTLFLTFFEKNGHTVVKSSPLVPPDPTLLFTNAGMVQFKDVFTGKASLGFTRAASVQKCVRAGGKHNDLDNVGRTARHHTFFEMLGNFSFGDYFKEEAIYLAHQLLVREMKLAKERLYYTVFRGEDGIPADDEARALWRRIAEVPDERVLGLGKKDNFWMMGDVGPQGPCSEIHYHQGDDLPCDEEAAGRRCLGPACDCDRFLEIWNLVFMQFERRQADGPLTPLPAPSIDTGAGLERLAAVAAGKRSNYDTDLFAPLIQEVAAACGRRYTGADTESDVAMRVLADHSRATAFLIADGVLPGNLGRNYVMRNIMRRAVRHAMRLELPRGFFARLCGTVVEIMGAAYPELVAARSLIEKAVDAEDASSRETISRGMREIAQFQGWEVVDGQRVLPGKFAFFLHDTLGFKLDLIQVLGREQGFAVDLAGFEAEMARARELSAGSKIGDKVTADIYKTLRGEVGPTTFTGYAREGGDRGTGQVLAILLGEAPVSQAEAGQEVEVVTDRTPFYGRAGGQVGDTGRARSLSPAGVELDLLDTTKPLPDLIVHRARILAGTLRVGDEIELLVDDERRTRTRRNHSATHLLHHALRQVLGAHVVQQGSYVGPDKLTFDFSHFAPLMPEELRQIEQLVNQAVQRNSAQEVIETTFDEARRLGALALFGEKYGDRVRMMRLGDSAELCGGTHVWRTGDIGLFKITSESSVAKGIRRIEALTGPAALQYLDRVQAELERAAGLLGTGPSGVAARVEKLLDELKGRDKEIARLKEQLMIGGGGGGLFSEERLIDGVKVVARRVEGADQKALREAAEKMRDKLQAGVVVLGGAEEGRAQLVVAVRKELTDRFHAGKLVGLLAPIVGGRGGGRPDLAQAGGTQVERLDEALARSFELLSGP